MQIIEKNNSLINFVNLFELGIQLNFDVLGSFEKQEAIQSKFFEKFEENASYYNAYLRYKKSILITKLIRFKLNDNNEKVIFLTEKGIIVLKKIEEIEKLIE